VPERDDRVDGIAQQDLKIGEGVKERAPVERVRMEHERRPCLQRQAIYLFFEIRSLL
jgi:hypothetical protein